MARYQLSEAHFLGNQYFDAGAIVDWEGPPSTKMVPVEDVAKERKARYDENRPHIRASRDLPMRAAMLHNPAARQPGMPRVAGPPGQIPAASADPANVQRMVDTAIAQREFTEQNDAAREAALDVSKPTAEEKSVEARRPKPEKAPAEQTATKRKDA